MADDVIKQVLQEELEEKKARKAAKLNQGRDASRQGKTLEEIESEEGGPIKESLVGMAQVKRAAKRKGGPVADTDLVEEVDKFEEELEVEEEDGVKLEAFNLKEERQKGYFDEAGNYVENEKDEEEDATDAWLASEEAKVVDEKTRQRIEAQQRQMEAAEAAEPLTAVQIARLQFQISKILQPGETVAAALNRLGGHANRPGKRAKRGGGKAAAAAVEAARDPKDKERFDQLTEAASTLVDSGETDVYIQDKGYFQRCAAVYIDVDEDGEEGAPGSKLLAGGVSKAVYDDADEDMFASDDEDKAATAAGKEGTRKEAEESKPPEKGKEESKRPEDTTDYASWPIKELRRFLQERGVDPSTIVEKSELVSKVKEAAAQDRPTVGASRGNALNVQAPPGYAFDPGSKMWYSADSGMYWDPKSGGFYNSGDGKWYSYSAEGRWEEWKQQ